LQPPMPTGQFSIESFSKIFLASKQKLSDWILYKVSK